VLTNLASQDVCRSAPLDGPVPCSAGRGIRASLPGGGRRELSAGALRLAV